MSDELVLSDGPDIHLSTDPKGVRVRLTKIGEVIRVTVEGYWDWDPKQTERTLGKRKP